MGQENILRQNKHRRNTQQYRTNAYAGPHPRACWSGAASSGSWPYGGDGIEPACNGASILFLRARINNVGISTRSIRLTVTSEPPIFTAAALKASKVLPVVGALILPTMPVYKYVRGHD